MTTLTAKAAHDIQPGDAVTLTTAGDIAVGASSATSGTSIRMGDNTITVTGSGDVEIASAGTCNRVIASDGTTTTAPAEAQDAPKAEEAAQAPAEPEKAPEAPAAAQEQPEEAKAVEPAPLSPSAYDILTAALDEKITNNPAVAGAAFKAAISETEDCTVASAALIFANDMDASIAADSLMSVDTLDVQQLGTCVLAKTKKKKKKDKEDKEDPEVVAQQLSVLHDGGAVRMLQKLFTTYVGDADLRHFMSFVGEVDKLVALHRTHVGKAAERPVAKDDDSEGGEGGDAEVGEDDEEDAPSGSKDVVA